MRMNMKFFLDYLDDQLDTSQTHQMVLMLKEDPEATKKLERLINVLKNPKVHYSSIEVQKWPSDIKIANYLEGNSKADELREIEILLEGDDCFLAHLATCHQVITGKVKQEILPQSYLRNYALGKDFGATQTPPPALQQKVSARKKQAVEPIPVVSKNLAMLLSGSLLMIGFGVLLMCFFAEPVKEEFAKNLKEVEVIPFILITDKKNLDAVAIPKETKSESPEAFKNEKAVATPLLNPITKVEPKVLKVINQADSIKVLEIAYIPDSLRDKTLLFSRTDGKAPFNQVVGVRALVSLTEYLCLPGCEVECEIAQGIQMKVLGENRMSFAEPLHFPAHFKFFANPEIKCDFAIKQGKCVINNIAANKFILRDWNINQAFEISLGRNSEVAFEVFEQKFYFGVLQGTCHIYVAGKEKPLPQLLAGSAVLIDSKGEVKKITSKETNLLLSSDFALFKNIPNQANLNASLSELLLVLKPGIDPTQAIFAYINAVNSNDARRYVGCMALAALGDGEKLLTLLRNDLPLMAIMRQSAARALFLWLRSEPERFILLFNPILNSGFLIDTGFDSTQSILILRLLAKMPINPTKLIYNELFDYLLQENKWIRELAYWQLCSYANMKNPPEFLRNSTPKSRTEEVTHWYELLENGLLPGAYN